MGGEEDDRKKWVKRYSSDHRILLVGDGDFSFSSSLARSFLSASSIVATSLDSYDILVKKFKKAKSNLEILQKLGASTFHGVDATKMKSHSDLKKQKFDRIIFNFPHAGFYGKEDDVRVIRMHMDLVEGFFSNANGMLRASGEVHVTHKTSFPFSRWNIEELARRNFLVLVECVGFKRKDYPGYNNKRGDGKRCDKAFPLGKCSTFKFRFSRALKKMSRLKFIRKMPQVNQDIPMHVHHQPTLPHTGHPGTSSFRSGVVDHQPPPPAFHEIMGNKKRANKKKDVLKSSSSSPSDKASSCSSNTSRNLKVIKSWASTADEADQKVRDKDIRDLVEQLAQLRKMLQALQANMTGVTSSVPKTAQAPQTSEIASKGKDTQTVSKTEIGESSSSKILSQATLPHMGHPGTSSFRSGVVDHQPPPPAFHCRTPNYSLTQKFKPTPEIYQRPIITDIDHFANRAVAHDRDSYIAEASRRFQQFQGNFDVMYHQDASFIHTELSKNVNELKGCTSAPSRFGVRTGSVTYSARSQGSEYERYMAMGGRTGAAAPAWLPAGEVTQESRSNYSHRTSTVRCPVELNTSVPSDVRLSNIFFICFKFFMRIFIFCFIFIVVLSLTSL